MRELLAHAASLGVTVHVAHLTAPFRGFYDHANARVVYDFTLTPIETRCVVAHELGHVFHGHTRKGIRAHEDAADLYAARLLIHPDHLAEAARTHSTRDAIADELRVERRLLDVFLARDVRRLGSRTYVRGRSGAVRFDHAE